LVTIVYGNGDHAAERAITAMGRQVQYVVVTVQFGEGKGTFEWPTTYQLKVEHLSIKRDRFVHIAAFEDWDYHGGRLIKEVPFLRLKKQMEYGLVKSNECILYERFRPQLDLWGASEALAGRCAGSEDGLCLK
jgi:hypothetical protein